LPSSFGLQLLPSNPSGSRIQTSQQNRSKYSLCGKFTRAGSDDRFAAKLLALFRNAIALRRQVHEGRLCARPPATFVPVRMVYAAPAQPHEMEPPPLPKGPAGAETVEIVLPDGYSLRVGNAVS
jgi:hypothetical protein